MSFTFGETDTLRPAFEDRSVPYIAYGSRFHSAAADHVENTLNATRVYIIASKSLSNNTAALKRLQDALGSKVVSTRIGMQPHTQWSEVVEIANDAAEHDVDCIVTLGASSLTDAAKLIAWMLANNITTIEGLDTMWDGSPTQNKELKPSSIRTVAIPTSLSGAEYQALAGATKDDGSHQKCMFYPPARNPSLVILDPELCTTTPERIWLSTGVRAIDHCVETLCSLQSNEAGDKAAEKGLTGLVRSLLLTKRDPGDLGARFQSQLSVIDAMSAVGSGVPLGGSHAIGHQLGPLNVGHGETSCIMLPAVCKWNKKQGANVEKQTHCKKVLLAEPVARDLLKGKSEVEVDLGDILDLVIRELGMPRTLKDVGVGSDKLEGLAKNTLTDPWAKTNAEPLTSKSQVIEILEMVVE